MSMNDTIATATTRENTIATAAQIWQASERVRKSSEAAARINSTLPYAPAKKGFFARLMGR